MKTIEAAQFKKQCLALLDRLDTEGLIITKHGMPVARVVPYDQQCADLIGSLQHKSKIRGNILTTGLRWDADAQSLQTHSRLHGRGRTPLTASRTTCRCSRATASSGGCSADFVDRNADT